LADADEVLVVAVGPAELGGVDVLEEPELMGLVVALVELFDAPRPLEAVDPPAALVGAGGSSGCTVMENAARLVRERPSETEMVIGLLLPESELVGLPDN